MEQFIDKYYSSKILEVINNIRIYVKVEVINSMSKYNGTKMESCLRDLPTKIPTGHRHSVESLYPNISKCAGTSSSAYL